MRWLTGTVSLVLFGAIIAYNSAVLYRWLVWRHAAHVVPFAAGLAGLAGFLTLPVDWFHRWVWLPMAADPALPLILALAAAGWRWASLHGAEPPTMGSGKRRVKRA